MSHKTATITSCFPQRPSVRLSLILEEGISRTSSSRGHGKRRPPPRDQQRRSLGWFTKWRYAEEKFLPGYAKRKGLSRHLPRQRALFVPHPSPGATTSSFRSLWARTAARWCCSGKGMERINDKGERMDKKYYLSPKNMAKELASYPRGTVTAVYMTSDGDSPLKTHSWSWLKSSRTTSALSAPTPRFNSPSTPRVGDSCDMPASSFRGIRVSHHFFINRTDVPPVK